MDRTNLQKGQREVLNLGDEVDGEVEVDGVGDASAVLPKI